MIGILIPAHNEEDLLEDCLEAALLAARHEWLGGETVEVLVVLDSCTDRSSEIVSAYPVHSLAIEARNVGQARDGHRPIHGADLGISADAYQRAGGGEPLACDGDVQLVRQLERCGANIAWSHRPQVRTSARLNSRARGGFGDYLQDLAQPV